MLLRISIKQIFRTPLATMLFLALFALAAFFVSCGAIVWSRAQATIRAYEGVFVTVGTVSQMSSHVETDSIWNSSSNETTRYYRRRYSETLPPSVLDFPGAGYALGPEKRPYYGAWRPDLALFPFSEQLRLTPKIVLEATPLEDCVPSSPVKMEVVRYLSEAIPGETITQIGPGDLIDFCDHYNPAPEPLYFGRTYIMVLRVKGPHSSEDAFVQTELCPTSTLFTSQYSRGSEDSPETPIYRSIQEVGDGFYGTEEGRIWIEYASNANNAIHTIPVIPTVGTHLLIPFYDGITYVVDGGDISVDEYRDGERVCLISEAFAERNGIAVGDSLRLPLYYADYATPPSYALFELNQLISDGIQRIANWDIGPPLNADGEPYRVFSDHEYYVKGIYRTTPGDDVDRALGANAVVIPAASVRESDEDNIVAYGRMMHATTSFEIPNGTIEAYKENWLRTGIEGLDFVFRDRGYTKIQPGLDNMKRISMLFLLIGLAMALALLLYFCHVFISQNRLRTAIERMLGFTKGQCAASLLSGFFIIAFAAIICGCALSARAESIVISRLEGQEYYDTTFTMGMVEEDAIEVEIVAVSSLYAPAIGLIMVVATSLIAGVFARSSIKAEPLLLLQARE